MSQGWKVLAGITVHPPSRCNMKHSGKPTKGEWKTEGLADSSHPQTSLMIKPPKGTEILDPALREQGFFLYACVRAKSLRLCPALCDPTDGSPSVSSVHGSLQARILEWVAMPSSKGSSQPRDRSRLSYVSWVGSRFFATNATWEAPFPCLSTLNQLMLDNSPFRTWLMLSELKSKGA